MSQTMTRVPAQKPPPPSPAATATVADLMRPPSTTVNQHDHAAAAAYLMKHNGTAALIVTDAQTAHAIADGKDVNDVWVNAVMTTRPVITTTTTNRDAATIMTTRHLHHLPVAGGTGLLGVVDIIDVCQALINADAR
jgi:CBS domain-containing protein